MIKNYVIDTNVLIYDPNSIYMFEDNNVVIPIFVIEEIDSFKREQSERGRNARYIIRQLDKLAQDGDLTQGVKIGKGKLYVVISNSHKINASLAIDANQADYKILQTALYIDSYSNYKTILVSMDANLRIRSRVLGIESQNYNNKRVDINTMDDGYTEMEMTSFIINKLYSDGSIKNDYGNFFPNEYIKFVSYENKSQSVLCKYDKKSDSIVKISPKDKVCGIKPSNLEQTFAFDALTDESIQLVTLMGKAGTGKTLLALAAGIDGAVNGRYSRILVSRPVVPMGRDIGYIPGNIDEKMQPWMQPIYDNIDVISMMSSSVRDINLLFNDGTIQIEPLVYIRGRSIPNQFIIIDEAQNLTPHEVKTIITRVGVGSKIVLTGDPNQIDTPYVDPSSNGLTVVANKFLDYDIAAHITFKKSERSTLADIASDIL